MNLGQLRLEHVGRAQEFANQAHPTAPSMFDQVIASKTYSMRNQSIADTPPHDWLTTSAQTVK